MANSEVNPPTAHPAAVPRGGPPRNAVPSTQPPAMNAVLITNAPTGFLAIAPTNVFPTASLPLSITPTAPLPSDAAPCPILLTTPPTDHMPVGSIRSVGSFNAYTYGFKL